MKAMRVYEVAALLIAVFWIVGCGASVRPGYSSNRPAVTSAAFTDHATAKLLYVSNVTGKTAQRFAMDAAMKVLTAAGSRLGLCCPATGKTQDRRGVVTCESCAWKIEVVKCEVKLLLQSLRASDARKVETCRLDSL